VFELVYRRQAGSPNEIWQADHTELDLWMVTPAGTPARPWLTVIEDDHSRAIAGYAVNLGAPSASQTALALRQAIWRKAEPGWHVCGIPAMFHTGHGSDFTSRHLEQAAADLGMRLVFSLARAAARPGKGGALPGHDQPDVPGGPARLRPRAAPGTAPGRPG